MRKRRKGGLYLEQLILADNLTRNPIAAHQGGGIARNIERLLVGVIVGNAALKALIGDARGAHDVFQRSVAVSTQRHQLLHIALESSVVALAQKEQTPAPLLPIQTRPKKQGRVIAEHPLQRLERCLPVGPRLAVAH